MPYGPNAPSICPDEYAFHCSAPDCSLHSHEENDFFKCESCGQLICLEHSRHDGPHRFCAECFLCSVCQEPAFVACEECGDLLCATCAQKVHAPADEWSQEDAHYYCPRVCQMEQLEARMKPVMREIGQGKREVIGQ